MLWFSVQVRAGPPDGNALEKARRQRTAGGNAALFHRLKFQEALELAHARGMAHFAQGLGFNLPDPLAGHVKLAANLLKGARVTVADAEAQFQHPALAVIEARENVAQFVL